MNLLLPGQAAVTRHAGGICLVVCDHRENLPIGGVAFEIRGGIHRISSGGFSVPVVSIMLRLTAGGDQRFYAGWVNELEEGVVELLANAGESETARNSTDVAAKGVAAIVVSPLRPAAAGRLDGSSVGCDAASTSSQIFAERRVEIAAGIRAVGEVLMAFDETLAGRIRDALASKRGIHEKKMFGGVGFLLNGNMLVGVWKNSLIVRIGPECYEDLLLEPHVRQFDITGKPMKGWIMVEAEGVVEDAQLKDWIERANTLVETLPAK